MLNVRRFAGRNMNEPTGKTALLLGAGFAKPWGLPLTSELMRFDQVRQHRFPGVWQQKTIAQIESLWLDRHAEHQGSVDHFGRTLRGTELFDPFVRYLALRVSSRHWCVGGARETKWGKGDHVAKQARLPGAYSQLIQVLKTTELVGVVTTNYDVVLEKLLGPRDSGRLGGFNYGRVAEPLIGRHYTSSRGAYGPVKLTGRVPLAKVHGSLNWGLSEDGCLVRYVDCRPSRGRRYQVALFPPGGEDPSPFQGVIRLAREILFAANIWLVIGYSLPDGDDDVRELIQGSASNVEVVYVADPRGTEVVRRLQGVIQARNTDCRFGILPELGSQELPRMLLRALKAARE